MTVDLPVVHHRALQATRHIVAGIGDDQWHEPTPCPDWDVRGLLNHIVAGNKWVRPLVEGETIAAVGDRLDGDQLGHSPLMAYEASAADADRAFCEGAAMDAPCAVSYGPVPGAVFCGHRFVDVLVHGWDLAEATGQDTTLDPELVEAGLEVVGPERELLAASGSFGSPFDPGDDADPQTRLLAWLGRGARPAP
jgi:uncharacterized protein (TIGR03086 family)